MTRDNISAAAALILDSFLAWDEDEGTWKRPNCVMSTVPVRVAFGYLEQEAPDMYHDIMCRMLEVQMDLHNVLESNGLTYNCMGVDGSAKIFEIIGLDLADL